jgi:anhydro-N-acetylmuramic acid kinase
MAIEKVLGIMSGTSLDGVDYALCEINSKSISLKGLWSVAYPAKLKSLLMAAATGTLDSYSLAQLHHDLGRFYAAKAPKVRCDYAGIHGQTIFHNPTRDRGATFQLGEPAYLAVRLQAPVVSQFRTMDLALGGQGAPLATAFHRAVFSSPKLDVAVNNLGGISNVTYLPKGGRGKILSFDTGPANMLMDQLISQITKGRQTFDRDGQCAARGLSHPLLVAKWLKHPFFSKRPPKSTGREEFGTEFATRIWNDCRREKLKLNDIMATVTDFTAHSLALSYEKFLPRWPDLVVLCGGGATNPTLVKAIRRALRERQWAAGEVKAPIDVTVTDALGWPTQSIEAAAFAFLAYCTMNRVHGNIPQTTGARRSAVLGQITPL